MLPAKGHDSELRIRLMFAITIWTIAVPVFYFALAVWIQFGHLGLQDSLRHVWEFTAVAFLVMSVFGIILFYNIDKIVLKRLLSAETENQKLQTQIGRASALASLGSLTTEIAHEVSNPLAIIIAMADMANLKMKKRYLSSADDLCLSMKKISEAGQRISKIMRTSLQLSSEDSDIVFNMNLHDVIDQTLSMGNFLFRRIQVDRDFRSRHQFIKANLDQIQKVILNLVTNAREAAENEVAPKIIVTTEDEGPWLLLKVTDNGPVIDPTIQPNIFSPSFTIDPSGKRARPGLSHCLGIIEKLGGTITSDSEIGRGTCFTVRLPIQNLNSDSTITKETPIYPLGGHYRPRALIVDDERDIRSVLSMIVKGENIEVEEAANGSVALELLNKNDYDFLFLDLKMPVMTGTDLILKLLNDVRHKNLKIVVMTSNFLGEIPLQRRSLVLSRANGTLEKPFNRVDIVRSIAKMKALSESEITEVPLAFQIKG